ncbi:MAG: ROK family protein [Deltaproteobacteria bacterium]
MAKKFIIGIDLGGTNLKIALLNPKFRIAYKEILSTKNFLSKASLIEAIIKAVNKVILENNLTRKDILGVGAGLPGPIDAKQGLVHFLPNIAGWKDVKLKQILEKKLRLPVFLDNDANLMCLAEYEMGAARGAKNAVCITLGTGVGGGIIIDGKLYRGSAFAAGEIGHIPINENGPKCNCGGVACLEAYIGNNKIIREAAASFKKKLTLEELSRMAHSGNRRARQIWETVARRLGIALSGVINLINPDCIVIGGGVANAGRLLFDNVIKTVSERAMTVQSEHVRIFKAKLGDDAGLVGAAILAKRGVHG